MATCWTELVVEIWRIRGLSLKLKKKSFLCVDIIFFRLKKENSPKKTLGEIKIQVGYIIQIKRVFYILTNCGVFFTQKMAENFSFYSVNSTKKLLFIWKNSLNFPYEKIEKRKEKTLVGSLTSNTRRENIFSKKNTRKQRK